MMKFLSVDFGTSSVKLSVLDEQLNTLKSGKVAYSYQLLKGEKVELDPDTVFNAFVKGTKDMGDLVKEVDVVCFDTLSPSLVFMDKSGNAVYPIVTHLDRRSRKQSGYIDRVMGKENYQKIAGVYPFTGGVSLTNLLWFMQNQPEVPEKAYKIGHLNSYIYARLTGLFATDIVNASMMGLYETTKQTTWSKEIVETFGVNSSLLPDIHIPGEILGKLTKEVAQATGLREGLPVALGSNDAASAQVGAGNDQPGQILNISGSSEMISILTDKPVVHPKYYLRNAVTPGLWQIYATTPGGFAIDWFRKEFFREVEINHFYGPVLADVIEKEIHNKAVGFMPYLSGDRQSMRRKRGSFTNLTLGTTREQMLAALLRGTHEPIADTIEAARSVVQFKGNIKVTGGLSSDAYMTLKGVMLPGFEFVIVDDCPILGNAKLAMRGLKNQK